MSFMLMMCYIFPVTDMLVAVLNTCTKEELEESESDEEVPVSPTSSPDSAERRKIIKGKILAVGRMARVFALLRFAHFFDSYRPISSNLIWYLGRNQRKFRSSKVYLVRTSCRMAHWHWARKVLKRL
jgi:hypothetical protein